jgi:hypothetical protein
MITQQQSKYSGFYQSFIYKKKSASKSQFYFFAKLTAIAFVAEILKPLSASIKFEENKNIKISIHREEEFLFYLWMKRHLLHYQNQ